MALVRFRVASRGRVEIHEVAGSEIEIGRDESCVLVVHHSSVAPRHARVLVRRGRLILADLGVAKTGTTRGRGRVLAPVTLSPDDTFSLGEVAFSARSISDVDRGLDDSASLGVEVRAEIDSADTGVRRYSVA